MRRSLAKIPTPVIGNASRHSLVSSYSFGFSTFSGGDGGSGRGRGRGSGISNFPFTPPGSTEADDKEHELGHGRGRSKPITPSTIRPPIFSSGSGVNPNSIPSGRGRGSVSMPPSPSPSPPTETHPSGSIKKPIFFAREDTVAASSIQENLTPKNQKPITQSDIQSSIFSALSSGAGRGKSTEPPSNFDDKAKEENRHLRRRQSSVSSDRKIGESTESSAPSPSRSQSASLSREDAVRRAIEILKKGGVGGGVSTGGREGGVGKGRGGVRGRGQRDRRDRDAHVDHGSGLYLGDDADGEKFAQRIGPKNSKELEAAFEELSASVLPSPLDDAYLDALHTNLLIELEPEYLMEEFGTNPDIDDKPPIPLREALEKMKPFLMAYEGIQSHEEWEEIMKETMERVPLLKEIVDYYSGPERVTAKVQQQELERVAKTLPKSAPASVKRFTDRAVLSLQSNPGWGFDKKCQFMDKLVWEVSQHHK